MELSSSKHSSKLEPFLLMGKSARGAAAAKLIQDATTAPAVFVFGELLELPSVQELEKNEAHAKFYQLGKLFAYGTYEDYLKNKDTLPPLNNAQIIKLKQLSIVSLASERRLIPYEDLLKALEITNVRELEDLIIDAIYLDMLQGKLDQKENQLEVEYTMGRDVNVAEGGLEDILRALQNWSATTTSVLTTLDAKLTQLATAAAAKKTAETEYNKQLQQNLKEVTSSSAGGERGERGLGGFMNMISGRGGDRDRGERERNEREREREYYREVYDGEGAGGSREKKSGGGSGGGFGLGLGKMRRTMFGDSRSENREREREESMDVDEPTFSGGTKNRKTSQDSNSSKPTRKKSKF